MRQPLLAVQKYCSDQVEVVDGDQLEPMVFQWAPDVLDWDIPIELVSYPDVDVMVFQRPLHAKWQHVFRLLRQCGIAVVVDMDDNFDRIDTANISWMSVEPNWIPVAELAELRDKFGQVRTTKVSSHGTFKFCPNHIGQNNRRHLNDALKYASLITVSTPALYTHYSKIVDVPILVCENRVPEEYLSIPHPKNDVPVITWTGSLMTHPRDLREVGGAIKQLRDNGFDFKLRIVGTGVGVENDLGIEPDESTGWVALEEYPYEYAKADIALCPLENTVFNECKSWLKGVEAEALGVIPVMSDLPEYRRLNNAGVGYIARKPREWYGILKHLLKDHVLAQPRQDAKMWTYNEQAAINWSIAWLKAKLSN